MLHNWITSLYIEDHTNNIVFHRHLQSNDGDVVGLVTLRNCRVHGGFNKLTISNLLWYYCIAEITKVRLSGRHWWQRWQGEKPFNDIKRKTQTKTRKEGKVKGDISQCLQFWQWVIATLIPSYMPHGFRSGHYFSLRMHIKVLCSHACAANVSGN